MASLCCRHCGATGPAGAPLDHQPLCPVPTVHADVNRAGVREIAISDYVDAAAAVLAKPVPADGAQTTLVRDVFTDMGSLILNWGLRDGYAAAERHILSAVAADPAVVAELQQIFDAHRPR